jgi:hypothetical protein
MIEAVDLGVIMTLIGKIGWDEKTRRKNGYGKNGHVALVARISALEAKVETVAAEIRMDLKESHDWAAEHHGDLHARITVTQTAIARVEGRLDK